METIFWENDRVPCHSQETCKIEKYFSPNLTNYFIQEVRKYGSTNL